ncbi:DUF554 family protein [Limosilactobacillus fermentum]|uniref:DUF554 family protein n=1 Tax=Limosilactobacillus fermentum TaxID=1613 RepID=UPI0023E3BC1E|nr:DUF554 family protein [Limosilactobacillus fermentum]MDF4005620.1 DUF554 family protein [Limosilactobacillus fermentum]MDF4014605.1 DUF554 family protein [Limosilactobacillus fermentum]
MIGTYLNTLAILVGTGIGCLLHGGIKPRYQEVLYLAIGLAAPVLFCWQGGIYLVTKYLSTSFFSASFITEISIVGGLLIAASGISLLKLREIKTVNLLPALLIPVLFFLCKSWV